MNELQLIKSDKFGLVEYDIYSDGKEMFMTSEQLGECLRFSNGRKGIDNIVARNEYLKAPEFSTTLKLRAVDGKMRDVRVFAEDGIYEVTMLANTDVAKEFRARVRKVLKALRSGEITAKPGRALETEEYHYLPKTLNGEPVITLADFDHYTGVIPCTARRAIYLIGKEGEDYVLISQRELAMFKVENPGFTKSLKALIVIKKPGVEKLLRYFGCKAELPMIGEKKAEMPIEVPKPKRPNTDECIVALNVLRYIRQRTLTWRQEDKTSGFTRMLDGYDKDIAAIDKVLKSVGNLVAAGY